MPQPSILLGDTTTHGGKVITACSGLTVAGIPVAAVGDSVQCPLCKSTFPILAAGAPVKYQNKEVATAGMKTACGAELIASQTKVKL